MSAPLPPWAAEIAALYESHAASQFILSGNLQDRFLLPPGADPAPVSLREFLLQALLPGFEVVLSYDLGNGVRIERGGEAFSLWPACKEHPELPKAPRPAVEFLTRYFRYNANLARLGQTTRRTACIVQAAHLLAPALPGALHYDLNALALLLREWASDPLLTGHPLATFLLSDNVNDLHPLLVQNPRAALIKVPLPSAAELERGFQHLAASCPLALAPFQGKFDKLARQMTGSSLGAIETRLRLQQHRRTPLQEADIAALKKEIVERECSDLIEFIEPAKSLHDLHGQEALKTMLRQDFELWRQNDLQALPMGYLICGPIGTGKTYLVECLAGEAGVPVVKIKNFRDKWVGTSEGNLEKIFRLLQALGRCFVFLDEADQALGRRDSGGSDAGLSGRIYSMFAKEMSNAANRGRIIWVLASSRPDLIEVDLKRPGRVDVKIPIFPTATPAEGYGLLRTLCRCRSLELPTDIPPDLAPLIPDLLTPGAAEALSVKAYRLAKTQNLAAPDALRECLRDYQPPVAPSVIEAQMRLAVAEATDIAFIPERFRALRA